MLNNLENNHKILKIFSSVRCLNRDQLPRYLDGRLTDVEKHLVEQHLIDCDLCFDALQVLQQPQHRDKYQPLSVNIQQYIRSSIRKVSHVQKVERYQRKEQKKESFLIYFWIVAFIVLGAGGIYVIQQQNRLKATAPKPIAGANTAGVALPLSSQQQARETVATTVASKSAINNATNTPQTPTPPVKENIVKAVVKKDTVKIAEKPVIHPSKDDSALKKLTATAKVAELKQNEKVEKPAATTPAVKETTATAAAKTENRPEPKPVVKKEKEPAPKAAAPEASGTDEFLYKAAMVYHQQGDLNEAISRYKRLSASSGRYGELSRYQLAVCYRSKGQTGKARRMFKEVVRMNGNMKDKAQEALDNL